MHPFKNRKLGKYPLTVAWLSFLGLIGISLQVVQHGWPF